MSDQPQPPGPQTTPPTTDSALSIASGSRPAPIHAGDLGLAAGMPFLLLTAALTPERAWRRLARALAPHAHPILSRDKDNIMACVNRIMGGGGEEFKMGGGGEEFKHPEGVARELVAAEIQRNFQIMRHHLPGGWRPSLALRGKEHIEAGLEKGLGVILWDSHFCFASQVTKMALHQEGFAVSHLSHPRHGYSSSRFGMAVLNPIQTRAEIPYLKERVVMSLDGAQAAMARLTQCLAENGVVSITVRDTGRRPAVVPFIAGTVRVAVGAPNLAFKTGAALVPVFTVQEEDGGFTTTAEEPLDIDASGDRADALRAAAAQYAKRLEPYVHKAPGQWFGWINL